MIGVDQPCTIFLLFSGDIRPIDHFSLPSTIESESLLITEYIQEALPLLPNLRHHQDYDQSMLPRSAWFRRMPPEDVRR